MYSADVSIGKPNSTARSREQWGSTFGTNKESGKGKKPPVPSADPNSYATTLGTPAAIATLLKQFRTMAPGGWSDNRWEQSNHFLGIAYVAIHRTSEQLAQSSFEVLQRDASSHNGFRAVGMGHPLAKLLERPNKEDTFGDLMYKWNQQMDLTGSGLTWMVPNKLGTPVELYPIPTALAVPQSTTTPEYPDGYYRIQPVYPYGPFSSYPTPLSAAGAVIPSQWMMRFMFPHPLLRYEGFAPLTGMRLHLDEIEAIDRSRWYAQRRAVNPSAVLNFTDSEGSEPLPEEEVARIHAEFENEHYGPENSGRLFVATPGAKLEQWGASPKEMDYQNSWEQLMAFNLAGLGITKEAAGIIGDTSYSTLFASLKQFHLLTLEPKLNRISNKLTRFLAPFFGDDLVVKIRCQRIDDGEEKRANLNMLMSARALDKNELRRELKYAPTTEEWGEEIAGDQRQLGQPEPAQQPSQVGLEPGAPGDGAMAAAAGASGPSNPPPPQPPSLEDDHDEPNSKNSRPVPGPDLSGGAMGPRKSLELKDSITKALTTDFRPKTKAIGDSRRAPDFSMTGSYIVETAKGPKTIFRDPENKWWYEDAPGHFSGNVLSTQNKTEAIQRLLEKYK